MCKNCFDYSEINTEVMDKNAELLAENIRLRQQLREASEQIRSAINILQAVRKVAENAMEEKI
jgi:hypothetical protein